MAPIGILSQFVRQDYFHTQLTIAFLHKYCRLTLSLRQLPRVDVCPGDICIAQKRILQEQDQIVQNVFDYKMSEFDPRGGHNFSNKQGCPL